MPLYNDIPDPELVKSFLDWTQDVTGRRPSAAQVIYAPVDSMDFDGLLSGGDLSRSDSLGGRFLTTIGDQAISCDATSGAGRPVRFRRLNRGVVPKKTIERIREAQKLSASDGRRYELRLLSIPDIFIDAIWLRSQDGAEDLILPVHCFDRELSSDAKLKADRFLAVARRIAERRQSHDVNRKQQSC